ncbi:hypothetical protein ABKV19_024216 [Rosa sericea]
MPTKPFRVSSSNINSRNAPSSRPSQSRYHFLSFCAAFSPQLGFWKRISFQRRHEGQVEEEAYEEVEEEAPKDETEIQVVAFIDRRSARRNFLVFVFLIK